MYWRCLLGSQDARAAYTDVWINWKKVSLYWMKLNRIESKETEAIGPCDWIDMNYSINININNNHNIKSDSTISHVVLLSIIINTRRERKRKTTENNSLYFVEHLSTYWDWFVDDYFCRINHVMFHWIEAVWQYL